MIISRDKPAANECTNFTSPETAASQDQYPWRGFFCNMSSPKPSEGKSIGNSADFLDLACATNRLGRELKS
jgi:hypothetical protein